MQHNYVSVIIPTYKDWMRLSICIAALFKQTYPSEMFEVLIVNNDSNGEMPVNFWLPENCRMLTEKKPGSYAARNAAIKEAKGEIIGFTDSDCIPDRNWIKNAVAYLRANGSCARIAGHISIFRSSLSASVGEKYDIVYGFPQKVYAEKYHVGVTGNLFTYKKIFNNIGLFNETLFSSGDLVWGRMAHSAGYSIHYVKDVIVHHPARNFKELVKKERRVGGAKGMKARKTSVKLLHFIKFLNGFRPRIAEVKYLYKMKTGLSAADKIKVLFLRHYLLNVRDLEKLRVQMGKEPNRI